MSHAVETMAFANEVPWHGLGAKVNDNLTPAQMCTAAGLDWTVSLQPTYVRTMVQDEHGIWSPEFVALEGRKALIRDTDGKVLGNCGDRWKPVQNTEALSFFKKFTEAGHTKMETAGSLHDGQFIWGLAKLGADFVLPGGDKVQGYILLLSPHKAGHALMARVTPIRVVCQNTLAMAMSLESKFEARFSHVRSFDPALAAETFGAAREQVRDFERNAHLLKQLNLSSEDVIRILAPTFQPGTKADPIDPELLVSSQDELNKPMVSLLGAYTNAPGADPGNGWGVLNAVTYHLDHSYGKNQSQRLFHSWLAKGAAQKTEVLNRLLDLTDKEHKIAA